MARQTLNNGISGLAFRNILNENFEDLYNNKAEKNHASSTTEFGVASTTAFGHIKVTAGSGLNIDGGVLSLRAANSSEAISGSASNVVMTPVRVKEAVNAYGVISDGNTIIKVQNSQPSPISGKTIIWINTSS